MPFFEYFKTQKTASLFDAFYFFVEPIIQKYVCQTHSNSSSIEHHASLFIVAEYTLRFLLSKDIRLNALAKRVSCFVFDEYNPILNKNVIRKIYNSSLFDSFYNNLIKKLFERCFSESQHIISVICYQVITDSIEKASVGISTLLKFIPTNFHDEFLSGLTIYAYFKGKFDYGSFQIGNHKEELLNLAFHFLKSPIHSIIREIIIPIYSNASLFAWSISAMSTLDNHVAFVDTFSIWFSESIVLGKGIFSRDIDEQSICMQSNVLQFLIEHIHIRIAKNFVFSIIDLVYGKAFNQSPISMSVLCPLTVILIEKCEYINKDY